MEMLMMRPPKSLISKLLSSIYIITVFTAAIPTITIPNNNTNTSTQAQPAASSHTHSHAGNPSVGKKQRDNTGYIAALGDTINDVQKSLIDTQRKLAELMAMIKNGQVRSLQNKQEATANLANLIALMQSFHTIRLGQSDPNEDIGTIIQLLNINQAIMAHVSKALAAGLHTFPPFDGSKRTMSSESETIEEKISANKQLFGKLSKQTDHAGLQWYNHAYRAFDATVVEPCIKYNIPSRLFFTGFLGLAAYSAWWSFSHESFHASNRVPQFVKNAFGVYPDPMLGFRTPDATVLGKLLSLLSRPDSLLAGTFLAAYAKQGIMEEWDLFKPKLVKELVTKRNRLKGGIHNTIADSLDGFVSQVTFDDLIGLDHIKDQFRLLIKYLENPEAYDRLGLTPGKGILLVGPPRTGKTLSIKALFNELEAIRKKNPANKNKITFYEVSGADIRRNGIEKVLLRARLHAPCILFIDELDLLNLQRDGSTTQLSEFLTSMSGLLESKDPQKQVILIAATNRPETIDFALREFGRFGLELRYELPTTDIRKKTLEHKLRQLSIDTQGLNLDAIARDTEGSSFEALNELVKVALTTARLSGEAFAQKHLEAALNGHLRHITPHLHKDISPEEQRLLATHFAGHALALSLLDGMNKVSLVTILPRKTTLREVTRWNHLFKNKADEPDQEKYEYGAVFTHHEHDTINIQTKDELLKQCKNHLAGIVAEEVLLGSSSHTCHHEDMEKALETAKVIAFEGIKEAKLPTKEQEKRFKAALEMVNTCKKELTLLFTQYKDKLVVLAQALEEQKQLSSEQIRALIQ
jgi:ATP-dependent Zn protease